MRTCLAERRESALVTGGTSPVGRVLEVEIEAVEIALAQEIDTGAYELGAVRLRGQHAGHQGRSEVPASDRQERLQRRVSCLDGVNPLIPDTGARIRPTCCSLFIPRARMPERARSRMHARSHVHARAGTCRHVHARTQARTQARTHARRHARTQARMYARTYTRTYVHMHARTHARTHARAQSIIYTHTHR